MKKHLELEYLLEQMLRVFFLLTFTSQALWTFIPIYFSLLSLHTMH